MTDLASRYDGRPLLRLLDAYVLDALGALDERTAAANEAHAAQIAAALQVEAPTWQQAVEQAMQMPPDSADGLRALWEQYVYETTDRGETPDVVAWAHEMVDARFGPE